MKHFYIILLVLTTLSCSDNENLTTPAEIPDVIAEFRPNLSELNLYTGNLKDLNITSKAFNYKVNTELFSDYSNKQRLIALPSGSSMEFNGNDLPIFPDKTVIAKTFYYNVDDRDLSLGKSIIETRVLIKLNGEWQTGNYKWNTDQTDATLDLNASSVPVTWIDLNGDTNSTNYKIPSDNQCYTCHRQDQTKQPIGFRMMALNSQIDGINQIQDLTNKQLLSNVPDISQIDILPKWDDPINFSREERARAYIDMNCAHCHKNGGYCETQSVLRLGYNIPFENTYIQQQKDNMIFRVSSDFQEGLTMPWIGTSMLHDEGVELIVDYLNSIF